MPENNYLDSIKQWNQTDRAYRLDVPLHRWVEDQIIRTPDAVAVRFEGQDLTYSELGRKSGVLADYLRALGVGPNVLVAVCLERSQEMVIALLGILRAGGAYVPIDPDYPAERVTFMLDDARTPVVLTVARLAANLPQTHGRVVALDTDWDEIASCPPFPGLENGPGDLAYMIYTSGSTGRPKGVRNTHRGIVNRLQWMMENFTLKDSRSFLQKTPFSFDISVWEFFWPLMTGGRLVLAKPGGHREPDYLCDLIQSESISAIHFVPSMLGAFLDHSAASRCTSLRDVFCSGEALTPALQKRFFETLPGRLQNLYGPTEAAVEVTWWECSVHDRLRTVPIGKPIANTRCYILDPEMRWLPPGESGELYLGGVQVAAGYHNRPELTAEKFIPDPFEPGEDRRLYRTGDLARWLPDGNIEFLGRLDHQVKLRGFRIELGEIESMLLSHPSVRDAVVIPHEASQGDTRLVAYLAARTSTTIDPHALRDHLRKILPDYMIPALFVSLERIPLTPNGKTDRKALPKPDFSIVSGSRPPFVTPAGPTEVLIAGIWSDLLKLSDIGSLDHFFSLGAHSVLALKMIAQVSRRLGKDIPLRCLFEHPTLATFSAAVDRIRVGEEVLPPLTRREPGSLPVASFAQQRLWFLDRYEPSSSSYNLVLGLDLLGDLDCAALTEALNTIVYRHESLRTVFVGDEGRLRVEIQSPRKMKLEFNDLRSHPESERLALAMSIGQDEARLPFDLTKSPLVRARLIQVGHNHHWLIVTFHHIVSDGWSLHVFHKELSTIYIQLTQGDSSPIPEPVLQFSDFAAWQRQWLKGTRLERQVDFWKKHLENAPVLLGMPLDHPRPTRQSFQGGLVTGDIPADLAAKLEQVARERGITRFMVLLAAFYALLYRYSRQEDMVVGTPVAERDETAAEGLIGLLVNTIPVRLILSENPYFSSLLDQVRTVVLDALANQTLPLEVLVERLNKPRNSSHSPIFQAVLGVQNFSPEPPPLGSVKARILDINTGGSKFDLFVNIDEREAGLHLYLEYNSDIFKQETASRFLLQYTRLLANLTKDLGCPINRIPLLDPTESKAMAAWGIGHQSQYPADTRLEQLFLEHVHRTPQAVAIYSDNAVYTYAELNLRAENLAIHLQEADIGEAHLVGVHIDRSAEFLVAILGCLKAGAAYVPLATDYPADRLRSMIEEARLAAIVTESPLPIETTGGIKTLDVRKMDVRPGKTRVLHPVNGSSSAVAYVMFTSGSTGKPKGVAVPHRAIVRLVCGQSYLPFGSDLRFLLLAPVSFDASTLEIWGPLLHGGRCVVYRPRHIAFDSLRDTLAAQSVSCLWLTASLFNQIIDLQPDVLRGVKYLLTGGEALSVKHVGKALQCLPDTHLINGYGPTEGTTFSTTYPIPRDWDASQHPSVPIGRPLANTCCYILDDALQPVPPGVPGALYIGGQGLALGYCHCPEFTAEKFIRNPWEPDTGGMLYCTGDLARWLSDGNIEYLGRMDHQVKLRGFRIEPGEIEAALLKHPAILEALVIVYEFSPGDQRLIAYTRTQPDTADQSIDLKGHLQRMLPDYMVPAIFIPVDRIPLTPNGKADRKSLPKPDLSYVSKRQVSLSEPSTATEKLVAGVWSEFLKREKIGSDDHFFELGGHSLLGIQVIARLNLRLQINIPLRILFEMPVLRDHARWIDSLLATTPPAQDGLGLAGSGWIEGEI